MRTEILRAQKKSFLLTRLARLPRGENGVRSALLYPDIILAPRTFVNTFRKIFPLPGGNIFPAEKISKKAAYILEIYTELC
jgi:hypothetical protein